MGNSIGGRKRAKVMKIDGETFKVKTPIRVWDVIKDYPGHVLLDSQAVKHFGIRATPLEPQIDLKPKKIYFLLQLPKFPEEERTPRRVRSGVHTSAKDRLEFLMLSRRSISDLAMVRPLSDMGGVGGSRLSNSGPLQVKMRLPRAQVARLVEEGKDEVDVAEKIMNLYMESGGGHGGDRGGDAVEERFRPSLRGLRDNVKGREKHVSFLPEEGEIQLDVAATQ